MLKYFSYSISPNRISFLIVDQICCKLIAQIELIEQTCCKDIVKEGLVIYHYGFKIFDVWISKLVITAYRHRLSLIVYRPIFAMECLLQDGA